jgi:hypothetical protein
VGRAWLRERVATFLANEQRRTRYLLITGEPGAGKSAFVAAQLRGETDPVFHAIKKSQGNWDEPSAFLRSLTGQLRRKHRLPEKDDERDLQPPDRFYRVLERVSAQLGPGQHEVIWVDGLDEAFGPSSRTHGVALPAALRPLLPPGILMVLTSRPGEHFAWLTSPDLCETIHLGDHPDANEADIRAYLEHVNRTEGLGLTREYIEMALSRTDRNFLYAAVLIRELRDLPAAERNTHKIPHGLDGWMTRQLEFIIDRWRAEKRKMRRRRP